MTKKIISWDLETHLINETYPAPIGHQGPAPIPVVMAYKEGKQSAQLTQDDMGTFVYDWLEDDDIVLLGQNLPFDFGCVIEHLNVPIELVFEKYNKGLVRDTMIREQLLALATGEAVRDPGKRYDLGSMVKKYLKKDISESKSEDAWRLRYSELYDVPLDEWPQEAIDYPLDDVTHTLKVFAAQHKQRELFQSNELAQTRAAFDLHLITLNSPRVDPKQVEAFKEAHIHQVEAARAPLIKAGVMKWNKDRYKKFDKDDERRGGWSMDTKKLAKAITNDYARQGLEVPLTETGKVSAKAETLLKCQNKHLKTYGEAAADIKLMDGFLPGLEVAAESVTRRVSPRYTTILKTGRTSCCVKHDTSVLTKELGNIPISEVKVGLHVWTHKERWRPVTHTWIHPEQEMITLGTTNSQKITCTIGHRFATIGNQWITAGELEYEYKQSMGEQPEERTRRQTALQTKRSTFKSSSDSKPFEYDRAQCQSYSQGTLHPRGAEDVERGEIVEVQDRGTQSHERQNRESPSQSRWGLRRWLRLFNKGQEREATVCTPHSNGRGIRTERVAGEFTHSPYQRRQEGQPIGQSGLVHYSWTPQNTFSTREGLQGCYLEKTDTSGLHEVYDITVEEDCSYYAEGVFNHNSKPNMQNPPQAPGVRECFLPEDGHVFVSIDFSSMEMYCLGQSVKDKFGSSELLDALNDDKDPHIMVCENISGQDYETLERLKGEKDEKTLNYRKLGKILNFGQGGGMGAETTVSNMSDKDLEILAELYPNEHPIPVMKSLGKIWRNQWNLTAFFEHAGRLCAGGKRPTYTCPITGRIKALNSYCQYCNMHFQPIAADAMKEALRLVTENCYTTGKLLNIHGVRLAVEIHDEFLMSGPEDSLDIWVPHTQRLMEKGAMTLLPDCKIKTEAGVCGSRWSKKDIELDKWLAGERHE